RCAMSDEGRAFAWKESSKPLLLSGFIDAWIVGDRVADLLAATSTTEPAGGVRNTLQPTPGLFGSNNAFRRPTAANPTTPTLELLPQALHCTPSRLPDRPHVHRGSWKGFP